MKTLSDIYDLTKEEFERLPEEFRGQCQDVIFIIENFPDDDVCKEMKLKSPYDLLGLYSGFPLISRRFFSTYGTRYRPPDKIYLYRRPLLQFTKESKQKLNDVVRHVLIHEIGHHFGYSDEEMEAIDNSK